MEKDTARYRNKRIDIDSLLNREEAYVSKKLDLDNLLGQHGTVRTPVSQPVRKEREVRHLSPGEYIVVMSM
ncbi:MAG: hypothetical protein WAW23_09920, partial [Candidatus Methanoperedens sp.]